MDTLPTITRYTGKVLILHGDRDTLVNISGSQKAAEAYEAAGADVRFQIIPGGKHIFRSPKHIKTAANAISEFAAQIMEKKSQAALKSILRKKDKIMSQKKKMKIISWIRSMPD